MTIECIPNVSEGRSTEVIQELAFAISKTDGVRLLHTDSNFDANRTVFTFIGSGSAIVRGALNLYRAASRLINMETHRGEHPRIGAVDVCPIVPLSGASMEECVDLALTLAHSVAEELRVPVYLYEYSARIEERRSLARIRKGEYEGLSEKLRDPAWLPDMGPNSISRRFGATVIGARRILVAYNVNLATEKMDIAQKVASTIRLEREKDPKLQSLRVLPWKMPRYSCTQISTNITDIDVLGLHDVYDLVKRHALACATNVTGSELIGLVPRSTLLCRSHGAASSSQQIEEAIEYLGLRSVGPFLAKERIIEEVSRL